MEYYRSIQNIYIFLNYSIIQKPKILFIYIFFFKKKEKKFFKSLIKIII